MLNNITFEENTVRIKVRSDHPIWSDDYNDSSDGTIELNSSGSGIYNYGELTEYADAKSIGGFLSYSDLGKIVESDADRVILEKEQ